MIVTNQERKALNKSALILGCVMAILGVFLALGANLVLGEMAVALFIIGVGFAGLGMVVLVKGGQFGEEYVLKKRTEAADLAGDNQGIVWVWIVALLTWAIMAIAYFSLSMVVYMVLDSVEAFYPWGAQELGVISLTRNVTAWFLIIMTVGIIGWALINSARKEDPTYPAY